MNIAILIIGTISTIIVLWLLWLLAHLIIEAALYLVVWYKYKRSNEK